MTKIPLYLKNKKTLCLPLSSPIIFPDLHLQHITSQLLHRPSNLGLRSPSCRRFRSPSTSIFKHPAAARHQHHLHFAIHPPSSTLAIAYLHPLHIPNRKPSTTTAVSSRHTPLASATRRHQSNKHGPERNFHEYEEYRFVL
ncbi:hypothetical protein Hanom_Chr10g00901611 [Helianthus anomalus]